MVLCRTALYCVSQPSEWICTSQVLFQQNRSEIIWVNLARGVIAGILNHCQLVE
jgi:hypothetical protein